MHTAPVPVTDSAGTSGNDLAGTLTTWGDTKINEVLKLIHWVFCALLN